MIGADTPWLQDALSGLAGYLIGGIPFGYLIFKAIRGVDIRTVGSGNIGATNVGRMLGFRYFLLVFTLDLLKGLLPTLGIPWVVARAGGEPSPDLAVFSALGAILGHNFPVYLGFRGGKGVATSLGALLALDPVASAAAAVAWFATFGLTRIVSASSIAGAVGFVAAYFARTPEPWSRERLAMSLFAIAIAILLIGRHRKNLKRLMDGTEPRVSLRKGPKVNDESDKQPPARIVPAGLITSGALLAAAAIGAGAWLVRHASAPIEVAAGPLSLREAHRELTGQQRTTRVRFANDGEMLAVMCPRYNKVLVYRVDESLRTESGVEIALDGRPVAIATEGDVLRVLQRPPGDDKHLGPGWWECFALDGARRGPRVPAGYYPDDLAVTPDGRFALVLSSGRAEGDATKPSPRLEVFDLASRADHGDAPSPAGRLDLDPADDPDRLVLSASGTRALIRLAHADQALAVDLSRPAEPKLVGRSAVNTSGAPYLSRGPDGDSILMPGSPESEAIAMEIPGLSGGVARTGLGDASDSPSTATPFLAIARPEESCLEIVHDGSPRQTLGRFPMKGPFNLGGTHPSGLAYSPHRGLLAVATKPGTVHLIEVRLRTGR
ncbi:Glycerol-3-phosphate acyltransferase [Aquisphaera giovannonii]|uniref:Glycerol-3-phosphate acyltransferase n=1 Tax=Aquisphaera giovannonii TaxID=406548 RepID=A0A5B9WAT6_9BACT|nr:glycerol-3-phosphate 1-O-acyltransferase PlsY [Aquisphaera giovannonii]QEH37364.1 Glycerol-3-phosphate acyltransferase [Aquisphaera giovannonii]